MGFETKYACEKCDHIFYRLTDHDPRKKKGRPPSCPECKKTKISFQSQIKVRGDIKPQTEDQKNTAIQEIISTKTFPSAGKGAFTKAMDETAKMVMEDYKMTNLNDHLREGDNMVPKLRPDLEEKVGMGWNKDQKNNVAGLAGANLNKAITGAINSNRYASQGDVVSKAMSVVERPHVNIINEYRPEKPS